MGVDIYYIPKHARAGMPGSCIHRCRRGDMAHPIFHRRRRSAARPQMCRYQDIMGYACNYNALIHSVWGACSHGVSVCAYSASACMCRGV